MEVAVLAGGISIMGQLQTIYMLMTTIYDFCQTAFRFNQTFREFKEFVTDIEKSLKNNEKKTFTEDAKKHLDKLEEKLLCAVNLLCQLEQSRWKIAKITGTAVGEFERLRREILESLILLLSNIVLPEYSGRQRTDGQDHPDRQRPTAFIPPDDTNHRDRQHSTFSYVAHTHDPRTGGNMAVRLDVRSVQPPDDTNHRDRQHSTFSYVAHTHDPRTGGNMAVRLDVRSVQPPDDTNHPDRQHSTSGYVVHIHDPRTGGNIFRLLCPYCNPSPEYGQRTPEIAAPPSHFFHGHR